jgi:cytochrome c-type biogenesis protein
MDLAMLQLALERPGLAGLGIGFLAGFVFSFNAVAVAAIPVTLAYVTRAHEPRRALWLGGAFIAGLLVTHAALGVAASFGGAWFQNVMGRWWGLVLGPVLIVLGLIWPGWLKLRIPWFSLRAPAVSGAWGAFLLAIPFSVAVCPICTPALLVMLTAAAAIGSVSFGFALLVAFALGRSVPIVLGALAVGWLESLKALTRWQKGFEIAGALTLIASGAYLIQQYYEMPM